MKKLFAAFAVFAVFVAKGAAQGDGGYRLVPNWPKLPPGMYFGLKTAPAPLAPQEAAAHS